MIMRNLVLSIVIVVSCLTSFDTFSQTESDQELLGLPGDNLDLYAVLNIFQKSKTIEEFEKTINEESAGVNNLDLNNDGKVDFIKVVTEKDGDDFLFILQDPISEKETQDVAVISVAKDSEGKISMQIIGDKDLYGKDYVVEPTTKATPAVTANPGYTGDEPPVESVPASTTVVVVESAPVVQYVYSPAYVPYYPPYYYGYYPPYYRAFTVMAVGIYRHNNYYHHHGYHGYHGGHGNTVVIRNNNQINNYNNNKRNTSNTVNNNVKRGDYNTSGKAGTRPSTSQTGRASTGNSASTRPSTSQTNRSAGSSSATKRATTPSTSNRASSNYSSGSRSRTSSPSYSRPTTSPTRSMSRGGGGRRRF